LIGWIPASIWAAMDAQDDSSQKRIAKYLKNVREYNGQKAIC